MQPTMESREKEILVTGATGAQGGAVVRHLLQHGWPVRALCRDPGTPAARALAEAGVRVLRGDLGDRTSLDEAVKGAHGVFGLQNFWDGAPASLLGSEGEVQQGKNLLDAAKAAGVKHFVQASITGAGTSTGVPHLESKRAIEKYASSLLLPATFLRPVFFMDNFNVPHLGFQAPVLEGRVDMPLLEHKKFQMVAVDDIGHFTAMVFERPGEFVGTAFELASDELTGPELAATFSRVMGRPVRFTGDPAYIAEIRKFSEDFARMYEWINEDGFNAFVPGLRALHPGLCTFESFLRKTGWETKA
jgi:uncharacterized protein YbjT (DUF2867 family)